jgi:hypothetical protein
VFAVIGCASSDALGSVRIATPSAVSDAPTAERLAQGPTPETAASTVVPHVDVSPFEVVRISEIRGAPPGGTAHVVVQTAPGLTCRLQYITPEGVVSSSSALQAKMTDGLGRATWEWLIEPGTPTGPGKVTATCSNGLSWHEYIVVNER